MSVTVRVEPIDKDIEVIFKQDLSPEARSATLAQFARDQLANAEQVDLSVLGHIPPHKTFVDGREGSSEDGVRPDGVIVYSFEIVSDLLIWIAEQLVKHSPVLTGKYQKSFLLYADGNQVEVGAELPEASEYVFVNAQPYARKIELGLSPQAPDGVFHVVATMAQQQFRDVAKIAFTYRSPVGGVFLTGKGGNRSENRTPAISITTRK